MTDQYLPPAPDQHDTAAFARPVPPTAQGQAAGGGSHDWFVPGQAIPVGNPEAEYWASRFRRQRTWTRVMVAAVALGAVVTVGLGITAVQAFRSNPLVAAASNLGESLGQTPDLALPGTGGGNDLPEGAAPQSPSDGVQPQGPGTDGQAIPLPAPLQGLGNALGITDARQLIDLAVANGLMSEEDADKVRAALEAGRAIQGLTGSGDAPAVS
jgi:hypothetical protein